MEDKHQKPAFAEDQHPDISSDDITKSEDSSERTDADEEIYPPRKVVVPAIAAVYLAVFLVALDRTILGTAVPSITDDFQSFDDVAWYEAAYLLPLCALLLSFGRVYTYYTAKWVLFTLVALFELGSIVCALAPNSNALIVGRAISGAGSAGISSGAMIMINQLLPLQSRPKVTGGIGAMFGLASILGPILGGYLTSITWRWCFWINVPIGAVSLAVLFFLIKQNPAPVKPAGSLKGKILELDPLGFVLIAPAVTCLLFALQLGGVRYAWNDGRIIAFFVVAGVLGAAFIASQVWAGEKATIPPRIFRQRSVLSGSVVTVAAGTLLVVFPYYLPIWFQVVQGKSPQDSGLALIPLLLSSVLLVITSGILTSQFGYYTQYPIIGGAFLIVGSALISTWKVDTGASIWIEYQIIAGAGTGLCLQGPNIAAQTVLSPEDAAIGFSVLSFVSFLGGSIFVTVCQTLLANKLVASLTSLIPGIDASAIANSGATSVRDLVSADQLPTVLEAYDDAMKSIWYLALGMACLVFVSSWGLEWKSVKKAQKKDTMPMA